MKQSRIKKMIFPILLMLLVLVFGTRSSSCEELSSETENETIPVIVMADLLNGRANPRKTGFIEARFDYGDILKATGEWSEDHHWIEVYGGETGTVWVYADYVSEEKYPTMMHNEEYKTVKIRSRPVNGKITGYLRKGRSIEVTRVVLGWGKCRKGWIDLTYLEEGE